MADIHISLAAEPILVLGNLIVTNSVLTGALATLILIILAIAGRRLITLRPKRGVGNVLEMITETLLHVIEQITQDRAKAERFLPLLMTIFSFIIVNNWLGLLPGVGPITSGGVPLFRAATADLNTTLALAVISVVMTHVYAIQRLGTLKHLSKYISWNPVLLFVGILELISEFSKLISFSFRLFGNIFAGEVLLAVIGFLVPVFAPLPFLGLELFVGFIQALVFTMLSLVFLEIATSDHGAHDSHDADELPDSSRHSLQSEGTGVVETAPIHS